MLNLLEGVKLLNTWGIALYMYNVHDLRRIKIEENILTYTLQLQSAC